MQKVKCKIKPYFNYLEKNGKSLVIKYMNKTELLQVLAKLDITPGKRFGQNFMIDGNLLDFISREANINEGDLVVEVGPGCGALTRKILEKGATLIAVEIDKRICEYLTDNLPHPKFTLVQGDACRVNIIEQIKQIAENEFEMRKWKCVANLPYSISSPFIAKLLETPCPPAEMLFLLQKETGQRLSAKPGTKNYGSLSVRVQSVFDVEFIRTIPPAVFYPAPDVDSGLVRFKRKASFLDAEEMNQLSKTVKAAFSQRRKKMIKAISVIYGKEHSLAVFKTLNINTNVRAEELSPEKFQILSKALNHKN
jgi:16S rRNA (adenine1518-N6/adenine1519-N6)-dimethyltransferase